MFTTDATQVTRESVDRIPSVQKGINPFHSTCEHKEKRGTYEHGDVRNIIFWKRENVQREVSQHWINIDRNLSALSFVN